MRYAVYISADDQPFEFSSSYSDSVAARMEVDQINNWRNGVSAIVVKVFSPGQLVDPYAEELWPTTTPSEANKMQAQKRRETAE